MKIVDDEKSPNVKRLLTFAAGKALAERKLISYEKSVPGDGLKEPRVCICNYEEK